MNKNTTDGLAGQTYRSEENAGVVAGASVLLRQLCHDIIEPAMTIKLLAQRAEMESATSPSMALTLRQITEEADGISDLCEHSLDRHRVPVAVRLDILIGDRLNGQRCRYEGSIDFFTEPVMTEVPAAIITRIVNNLLDNACRAAGPQGKVRLVVGRQADEALISISDSGGGMGSGPPGKANLGLSIVEALVRECDGHLAMSEGELGGLRTVVSLPVFADRRDLGES